MKKNTRNDIGYVGAPYNFIGMNNKVYERPELIGHNTIGKDRHSGTITYKITAKTPIMVDDGTQHFYKDAYGTTAIPGSTMRGLVRGNLQLLSFSSIADDVQDGRLMYRNVANGRNKDRYNNILGNKAIPIILRSGKQTSISVLENVKAGYIKKDGNKYFIIPTVVDTISRELGQMNYYVLSERKIIEGNYQGFEYLKNLQPYKLQNMEGEFRVSTDNNRKHYKGQENRNYKPYYMEISYEKSGVRYISGIAEKGKLTKNGYLLSSGKMQEKKAIYIIPEIMDDRERYIEIPASAVDDFKRDYESRKNQVESMDGETGFFRLPEDGEQKPIFYIEFGGKFYFGFTPRLRLFYDKSIYDGIKKSHIDVRQDYCKAIFGFAGEGESYKSRVSFSDALLLECTEKQEEVSLILASPKPTSYLDYLTAAQEDDIASYNDNFELRGTKQYWLKENVDEPGTITNKKTASLIRPYASRTCFMGKIRFENLAEEELGMLLWSLLLEENSNQNLGKAKPYGYGRVMVELTGLDLLAYDAMYSTNSLSLNPYTNVYGKARDYIQKAKDDMTRFLGHDVMTDPRVKHFLMMKDGTCIPENERTRYMNIQKKEGKGEYQRRMTELAKLPTVEDVLAGRPAKSYKKSKNSINNKGDYNKESGYRNGRSGYGVQNTNRQQGSYGGNVGHGNNKVSNREKRTETVYRDSGSIGSSLADKLKNIKLEK